MAQKPQPTVEPPVAAGALEEQTAATAPATAPPPDPREAQAALPTTPLADVPPAAAGREERLGDILRTVARWALVLAALYTVGWLLWAARSALTPFIIGLVLAYLLTPIVNALNRRMPRPLAILLVYLGGITVVAGAFAFLLPPVVDQIERLLAQRPSLTQLERTFNNLIFQYRNTVPDQFQGPIDDGVQNGLATIRTNIDNYLQTAVSFLFDQVLLVINTVTFLIGFLIIPIWLFYVLNDQAKGHAFINQLLHPRLRADFWNVWQVIDRVFSNYIRGQLLLGLIIGAASGIGLLALDMFGFDVDYILLLAIIAGITELIPIVGPVLGAVPAVLIALFNDPLTALAVLILYIVIQQAENNFLVPRIIGESVGVHPAILTVVLIVLGYIFGLIGVILSAPLTAIARDLFVYTYRRLEGQPADHAISAVHGQHQRAAAGG